MEEYLRAVQNHLGMLRCSTYFQADAFAHWLVFGWLNILELCLRVPPKLLHTLLFSLFDFFGLLAFGHVAKPGRSVSSSLQSKGV